MARSGAYGAYKRNPESLVESKIPTKREVEIIELRSEGLSYKEVATKIDICEKTVSAHIYNVNRKLGTRNSTQSFRRMCELGYLQIKTESVPDHIVFEAISKMMPNIYNTVKQEILNGQRNTSD